MDGGKRWSQRRTQSAERRTRSEEVVSQACKGAQTEAIEVVREVAISQACKGTQTEATEVVRETSTTDASTNTGYRGQPHVARKRKPAKEKAEERRPAEQKEASQRKRAKDKTKEKTEGSQPKEDPKSKSVLEMVRRKAQFGKTTDSDEDFKEEMRMGFALYEFLKNPPIPKLPLLKIRNLTCKQTDKSR